MIRRQVLRKFISKISRYIFNRSFSSESSENYFSMILFLTRNRSETSKCWNKKKKINYPMSWFHAFWLAAILSLRENQCKNNRIMPWFDGHISFWKSTAEHLRHGHFTESSKVRSLLIRTWTFALDVWDINVKFIGRVESVAHGLVYVIRCAQNGSVWISEDGKPVYEVQLPDALPQKSEIEPMENQLEM